MERVSAKENIKPNKIHDVSGIFFEKDRMNICIDNTNYSFEISKISESLHKASEFERKYYQISPSGYGIHWPAIDEDLSIEGLLKKI